MLCPTPSPMISLQEVQSVRSLPPARAITTLRLLLLLSSCSLDVTSSHLLSFHLSFRSAGEQRGERPHFDPETHLKPSQPLAPCDVTSTTPPPLLESEPPGFQFSIVFIYFPPLFDSPVVSFCIRGREPFDVTPKKPSKGSTLSKYIFCKRDRVYTLRVYPAIRQNQNIPLFPYSTTSHKRKVS